MPAIPSKTATAARRPGRSRVYPTAAAATNASGTRPEKRWSATVVPASRWTKLSSRRCTATRADAPSTITTSAWPRATRARRPSCSANGSAAMLTRASLSHEGCERDLPDSRDGRAQPRPSRCRSHALGGEGQLVLELRESLGLELAHALARDAELLADRLQRLRLAADAEAQLDDPALPLGQRRDRPPHLATPNRVDSLVLGADGRVVAEQVAELPVVLGADGPVQRDVRLDGIERLFDVHELELGLLGQLLASRLAAELGLEPALGARELHASLVHVGRDANRRRLVRDRPLTGLADPPGGVGRELVAAPPVELLDGTVQPDHALLHEVE